MEKVQQALKNADYPDSEVTLQYDNIGNITGYVTNPAFEHASDSHVQGSIWASLQKCLSEEELRRIVAVYHETPDQKLSRSVGTATHDIPESQNISIHVTIDRTRYWLFVDVVQSADGYKAVYCVINSNRVLRKALTLNYPREVLEVMELRNPTEIRIELFRNAFEIGAAEVRLDLIKRMDDPTDHMSKARMFMERVYANDLMRQPNPAELIFDEQEIEYFRAVSEQLNEFGVGRRLNMYIDISMKIQGLAI